MKMNPVKSSNISALGFEPTDNKVGTLRVAFKSGDVWDYPGVKHEEAADLAQAPSVGKHFLAHIRPKYSASGKKIAIGD